MRRTVPTACRTAVRSASGFCHAAARPSQAALTAETCAQCGDGRKFSIMTNSVDSCPVRNAIARPSSPNPDPWSGRPGHNVTGY